MDFFIKYDQIRRNLRIWSHLLKKSAKFPHQKIRWNYGILRIIYFCFSVRGKFCNSSNAYLTSIFSSVFTTIKWSILRTTGKRWLVSWETFLMGKFSQGQKSLFDLYVFDNSSLDSIYEILREMYLWSTQGNVFFFSITLFPAHLNSRKDLEVGWKRSEYWELGGSNYRFESLICWNMFHCWWTNLYGLS